MFGRNSPWRLAALAVLTVGATAVTGTPAAPARADTGPVNVTVNVTAALIFTISGAVTLAGAPGDTPSDLNAVAMNVTTNNASGYTITVAPDTQFLTGPAGTLPFGDLEIQHSVASTGTPVLPFTKVGFPGPLTLVNTVAPSAVGGDNYLDSYRMTIPVAASGSYTGVLTYTAVANL